MLKVNDEVIRCGTLEVNHIPNLIVGEKYTIARVNPSSYNVFLNDENGNPTNIMNEKRCALVGVMSIPDEKTPLVSVLFDKSMVSLFFWSSLYSYRKSSYVGKIPTLHPFSIRDGFSVEDKIYCHLITSDGNPLVIIRKNLTQSIGKSINEIFINGNSIYLNREWSIYI